MSVFSTGAAAAISPEEYEQAFVEDERYFNFASLGPVSEPVVATGERLLRATATARPNDAAMIAAQVPRALAVLSRLSGFPEGNITLVSNTSSALVQVALGLPSGTSVISGRYQFPANVWPWRNAAETGRIALRLAGTLDEPVTPELLHAHLDAQCDAVAMSHVDFRTGYRADLTRIREAIGDRLLIVDAIQAFGAVEEDWTLADVVIAGGQKWMRAGQGTGFMALSDRALDRIRPLAANWGGIGDSLDIRRDDQKPRPGAGRFDPTRPSPVLAGCLAQALELVEGVGLDWIASRIQQRYERLADNAAGRGLRLLSDWPAEQRAGIAVIEAAGATAVNRLIDAGFTVTIHDTNRVRASLHATTRIAAIDELVEVLAGH
nr:aminotransferase class V-fold PLP-dependent enzyme [Rhizobium sp. ACO-34A]